MIKILFLAILLSSTFAASSDGAHFHDVRGKVTLTHSGSAAPATQGEAFAEGDVIETAKDSSAVLHLEDGTMLKLGPGSRLITSRIQDDADVSLESGSVISKVTPRKPGHHFAIRTSSAVMGVRGTQFYAGYNEKALWMCVHEGQVEIENLSDHGKTLVPSGKGVKVLDGKMTPPGVFEWTSKIDWEMKSKSSGPSPWDN